MMTEAQMDRETWQARVRAAAQVAALDALRISFGLRPSLTLHPYTEIISALVPLRELPDVHKVVHMFPAVIDRVVAQIGDAIEGGWLPKFTIDGDDWLAEQGIVVDRERHTAAFYVALAQHCRSGDLETIVRDMLIDRALKEYDMSTLGIVEIVPIPTSMTVADREERRAVAALDVKRCPIPTEHVQHVWMQGDEGFRCDGWWNVSSAAPSQSVQFETPARHPDDPTIPTSSDRVIEVDAARAVEVQVDQSLPALWCETERRHDPHEWTRFLKGQPELARRYRCSGFEPF